MEAKELAKLFHDVYERLAPSYGYKTKEETKTFDENSPNGKLMIATCDIILLEMQANRHEVLVSQAVSQALPEPNLLGEHNCDNCQYWKHCNKEIRYWNEEGHRIDAKLEYCSKWKTKLASQL